MADVNIIPRVRCDNCGLTTEKARRDNSHPPRDWERPRTWGSAKMEGSRSTDSYGGKVRLDFVDLCPGCAQAALEAAAEALKARRGERESQ